MAKAYTKSSVCERCGRTWVHNKYTHPRFCSSDCSNKRRGDNFEARFYARIDRSGGPDACWPWTGPTDKDGYGKVIHYSVGDTRAHRVALELHRGLPLRSLPASVIVRHSCDTPPCCNPAHLLDGTHADNSDDKVQRDRHTKGEDVNTARLTEAEVMEARELWRGGKPIKELCARFGLSKSAMWYAVSGRSWKHLPLLLLILLMAVPAFGQHPFIQPKLAPEPLVVHDLNYSPCLDTRTRAEKIAAGCIVEMGNGIEYHCAVGHGCVVVGDQLGLQDSILTPSGAPLPAKKFDRSFWLASSLWLGGSTADLVTTKFALERGGVESNPLHAQDGGHKLRWSSAIAASVGTWAFAAYCERKGHRRVARIVLITGAIVRTGLAFWNNSRRR